MTTATHPTPEPTDPIYAGVYEKIHAQAMKGLAKYGTRMDRTDLTTLDWLRHAQQEFIDGAVYLERIIQDLEAGRSPIPNTIPEEWR